MEEGQGADERNQGMSRSWVGGALRHEWGWFLEGWGPDSQSGEQIAQGVEGSQVRMEFP